MSRHWVSLNGRFVQTEVALTFLGEETTFIGQDGTPSPAPAVGFALTPGQFVGGRVSARVSFASADINTGCELVLYYETGTGQTVVAGISPSSPSLFAIRQWDGSRWTAHRVAGDRRNLEPGRAYELTGEVAGSRVTLMVDGVQVLAADVLYPSLETQVGVWCVSSAPITIADFSAQGHRARVFVAMPFTSPYEELYRAVIREVCTGLDLEVIRADEEYGPGLVVADMALQLGEASVVIADVTSANPNVYYEVGFAHALNKPTILLAERSASLPFDVAPHRVLFYENTIQGKAKFEEALRNHVTAALRGPQGRAMTASAPSWG